MEQVKLYALLKSNYTRICMFEINHDLNNFVL